MLIGFSGLYDVLILMRRYNDERSYVRHHTFFHHSLLVFTFCLDTYLAFQLGELAL